MANNQPPGQDMGKIDNTRRVRVYEVYEKVGNQLIKYVSLTGDEYVPYSVNDIQEIKAYNENENK